LGNIVVKWVGVVRCGKNMGDSGKNVVECGIICDRCGKLWEKMGSYGKWWKMMDDIGKI